MGIRLNASRREWLAGCLGVVGAAIAAPAAAQPSARRSIQTVAGAIDPAQLGVTLMHEHVLVDFIGAEEVSPSRYDADEVFARALPHLRQAKAQGCATLVECTPAYLGRDRGCCGGCPRRGPAHPLQHRLLRRRQGQAPAAARVHRDAAAARGALDPRVRAGHRRHGDQARLHEDRRRRRAAVGGRRKLVRAAAITHMATGLPIAAHTGNGVAALEELDILERDGVPRRRSSGCTRTASRTARCTGPRRAARGSSSTASPRRASTGTSPSSWRCEQAGRLGRVLLSHDAGWYHVGEPGGGEFRPFDTLLAAFVPALKAAGLTEAEVRQLLVDNPRRALTPARLAGGDQHRLDHVSDPVARRDVGLGDAGCLQRRAGSASCRSASDNWARPAPTCCSGVRW